MEIMRGKRQLAQHAPKRCGTEFSVMGLPVINFIWLEMHQRRGHWSPASRRQYMAVFENDLVISGAPR